MRLEQFNVRKQFVLGSLIYIIIAIVMCIVPFSVIFNKILAIVTLILSIIWVSKCRNNTYLLILSLFILYSNYSIIMGIYLDESLRPQYLYPQISDVNVYGRGIALLLLAMIALVSFHPKQRNSSHNLVDHFIVSSNGNQLAFLINFVLFLLIIVFGYETGSNSRGMSSPLYEYGSILLIMMFYYSGTKKKNIYAIGLVCMLYIFTSLKNGTRIEALICLIIFVLCYFRNGIKQSYLYIGVFIGIIVFSVVGSLRGNWQLLLNGNFKLFTLELFKNKFVFDTCTHAYFPMLCMIEQFSSISVRDAFSYLTAFIATIFLGQSRVVNGNLIKIVAQKYYHNYGGVTLGFFYTWFSYAGPYIFALMIMYYIKALYQTNNKHNLIKACAFLYLIASVPRWYLYGPWSMTRGVLICIIIFEIEYLIFKNMTKGRRESECIN